MIIAVQLKTQIVKILLGRSCRFIFWWSRIGIFFAFNTNILYPVGGGWTCRDLWCWLLDSCRSRCCPSSRSATLGFGCPWWFLVEHFASILSPKITKCSTCLQLLFLSCKVQYLVASCHLAHHKPLCAYCWLLGTLQQNKNPAACDLYVVVTEHVYYSLPLFWCFMWWRATLGTCRHLIKHTEHLRWTTRTFCRLLVWHRYCIQSRHHRLP